MKLEKVEYLVGEMAEAPNMLTVDGRGLATYESHTNETTPQIPEIGEYQARLDERDMVALDMLVADPPLASLPDHAGRVPSGAGYRLLSVSRGSTVIKKYIGPAEPIDGRLRDVLTGLDRLIEKLRAQPHRVLQVELGRPSVAADRRLSATVMFTNSGSERLLFRSPSALVGAGDGWLALHAWAEPAPPPAPASEMATIAIAEAEGSWPANDLRRTARSIELAPGGTASFSIEATLPDLPPGAYILRLSYANLARQLDGKPLVFGELLSKTVRAVIPATPR